MSWPWMKLCTLSGVATSIHRTMPRKICEQSVFLGEFHMPKNIPPPHLSISISIQCFRSPAAKSPFFGTPRWPAYAMHLSCILLKLQIFSSFLFTRAKHWKQLICETVKKIKKWILMKYKSITKMMVLFTREMLSEKKPRYKFYVLYNPYI